MNAADALISWLERQPTCDGATVVGWRLEVVEGVGVRLGVRDSRLGGAYDGLSSAVRLGGLLELHWSDGRLTSATLDRRAVLAPDGQLAGWRASAYIDRGGKLPPLAGPTDLPSVATFDPAVAAAVDADPAMLLGLLDRVRGDVLQAGARRVDGTLRASRGRRAVRTSRGFAADWEETTCTVELWADEIARAGYGRRSLPSATELDRMVSELARLAPLLRVQQSLPAEARGILFAPAVVDELIARLLLPNLSGRAIRDGRAPWTRDDLEAGRAVIRADLDLVVDTTMPLALASAPCSPDGVPAGRVALIAGGRLASPVLDLSTARDFGRPATPAPRGRPAALLVSQLPVIDGEAALGLLRDGVVVYDLPGLHTQQARRSRYALVAPDAQVISGGILGGRCAVRLAGSVLDHLSQPSTRLVRLAGELGVGLLVDTGVELLPA